MMLSYHDITVGLEKLGLNRSTPVLAHIAPANLGEIRGGTDTLLGAILATIDNVMMPSFTYSTMITPEKGPSDNFLQYGSGHAANLNASIFTRKLPCDTHDNEASEALRNYPGTFRSSHPILSFCGLGLDIALVDQTPQDLYAPIRKLMELDGWVALLGSDASENFSLHYAEHLAGRKQFIRWALTEDGIKECPDFPGCSNGFHKINYYLQDELRIAEVGDSRRYAVPLQILVNSAVALIREDPFALLCNSLSCPRCNLVRRFIKSQVSNRWQPEE
jgi:aminoglycoside 3-N-acetyltransferase